MFLSVKDAKDYSRRHTDKLRENTAVYSVGREIDNLINKDLRDVPKSIRVY